jgi:hypothetical protein
MHEINSLNDFHSAGVGDVAGRSTEIVLPPTFGSGVLLRSQPGWSAHISHRLHMARAARETAFEVHVATRVTDCGPQVEGKASSSNPVKCPAARSMLFVQW